MKSINKKLPTNTTNKNKDFVSKFEKILNKFQPGKIQPNKAHIQKKQTNEAFPNKYQPRAVTKHIMALPLRKKISHIVSKEDFESAVPANSLTSAGRIELRK